MIVGPRGQLHRIKKPRRRLPIDATSAVVHKLGRQLEDDNTDAQSDAVSIDVIGVPDDDTARPPLGPLAPYFP